MCLGGYGGVKLWWDGLLGFPGCGGMVRLAAGSWALDVRGRE